MQDELVTIVCARSMCCLSTHENCATGLGAKVKGEDRARNK